MPMDVVAKAICDWKSIRIRVWSAGESSVLPGVAVALVMTGVLSVSIGEKIVRAHAGERGTGKQAARVGGLGPLGRRFAWARLVGRSSTGRQVPEHVRSHLMLHPCPGVDALCEGVLDQRWQLLAEKYPQQAH